MSGCKTRAHVAVMFAFLVGATSAASAERPRLDLVWSDPTDIAAGTFATVATESRKLLSATGAEVTWTAAPRGAVVGPESIVVIAIPTYPTGLNRDRHVMGATRMVADGALAVWVFPDQVAWALGLDLGLRRSWGERTERSFGLAIARVASHEVVHALGAASHARSGLMTPRLDRNALTAPNLRIDGATVAALRRSFDRGARLADRTWTPSLLRGGPFTVAAELVAAPGSNH